MLLTILFILHSLVSMVTVHGNIQGDYCDVIEEYESFKTSLDNYLASRDELCQGKPIRSDCASIKKEFPEATGGVYRIKPRDGKPSFLGYCDMTESGGGWLVIQRRQGGSEDFYRTWFEYKDGFGNLTQDFWLGNEKIHRVTSQGRYELRVDLENKNVSRFAEYEFFRLGNMSTFYTLTVSGYVSTSTAVDKLYYNNNTRFSAKNLDLDTSNNNCCEKGHGAWWFADCTYVHLNGLYTRSDWGGVWWHPDSYKKSSMKIRPVH